MKGYVELRVQDALSGLDEDARSCWWLFIDMLANICTQMLPDLSEEQLSERVTRGTSTNMHIPDFTARVTRSQRYLSLDCDSVACRPHILC